MSAILSRRLEAEGLRTVDQRLHCGRRADNLCALDKVLLRDIPWFSARPACSHLPAIVDKLLQQFGQRGKARRG